LLLSPRGLLCNHRRRRATMICCGMTCREGCQHQPKNTTEPLMDPPSWTLTSTPRQNMKQYSYLCMKRHVASISLPQCTWPVARFDRRGTRTHRKYRSKTHSCCKQCRCCLWWWRQVSSMQDTIILTKKMCDTFTMRNPLN
jgi:hypothetical protein